MRFALFISLFIFVSCEGDSSSRSEKNTDYLCEESQTLCAKENEWTINSSSINFPKKFALYLNNQKTLDTCVNESTVTSINWEGRTLIELTYRLLPKGRLNLKIIDRGENCDNDAIFYENDNVPYLVREVTVAGELTHHDIQVRLEN